MKPLPLGDGAAVLAFDVGGTDTKTALFSPEGTMVAHERSPTPPAVDGILDLLAATTRAYATEFPAVLPQAVCLLVPGLVNPETGTGVFSSNLGWEDVPFKQLAEDRLELPVSFSHDVSGAGEAELRLGAARPFRNVAVVTIGTGIASALFIDGRPYTADGFAGELGHTIVEPNGRECPCGGRGHLETVGSAAAIAHRYTERTGTAARGASEVLIRAQDGDEVASLVWSEAIGALALGLSQLVALFAPEAVVIGGGLAAAGPVLFGPLERELDLLLTFHRRPPLIPAQLGGDAGLLGAALRARDLLASRP